MGSARTANRLVRVWRRDPSVVVSLKGPYRWHPPARVTPGEAWAHETGSTLAWEHVRCLKYTADDIARAPHAAACHVDWLTGPPGIKTFRTVALRADGGVWRALPGLREARGGTTFTVPPETLPADCTQLLALVCAEPWASTHWRAVAAVAASDDDVLAHSMAWLDHLRELAGEPAVSAEEMRSSEARLRATGLRPSVDSRGVGQPSQSTGGGVRSVVRGLAQGDHLTISGPWNELAHADELVEDRFQLPRRVSGDSHADLDVGLKAVIREIGGGYERIA